MVLKAAHEVAYTGTHVAAKSLHGTNRPRKSNLKVLGLKNVPMTNPRPLPGRYAHLDLDDASHGTATSILFQGSAWSGDTPTVTENTFAGS